MGFEFESHGGDNIGGRVGGAAAAATSKDGAGNKKEDDWSLGYEWMAFDVQR